MEKIKDIWFDNGRIYMRSDLGNTYNRPLEAFPILMEATDEERNAFSIEMHGQALRWKSLDEDIHISSFYESIEPETHNEIAEIFKRFPQLNVSEIARNIGINKSLLAKYIYGIKRPSRERITQIKEALHVLGGELVTV